MTTKGKKLTVEEVPEVAAFLDVQRRYEEFKQANEAFFKYLGALATEYNEKLVEAERVVKAKQVSCGPFEIYQTATSYDAEEMFTILGRDEFLNCGGIEEKVTKRTVDKARVEMHIGSGRIQKDAADVIKKVSGRYRRLPGVEVP